MNRCILGPVLAGAAVAMGNGSDRWSFREEALDNGLRVLTVEDRSTPLVSVQVWYHVGSKDEDPERQGFAHMFEHMMFRGTDRIGPQDHFKYLSRYGARVNGYTSFDQTVYWETLPASQLDLALWLEAERLGHLKINAEYFAAEREVVKEERRMRYLNRPYGKLYETLNATAYQVHPYRWTPIGNMPHLDAARVEELQAFFEKYYVPNNAMLVVVGAVSHDEVMAKARQYFGGIPRRPDPPRVSITEPPMTQPRVAEITDRAPSPLVLHAWHSPSDRDPDSVVLEVLSRILSSGQSSRLYRQLVHGREVAVQISGYNAAREDGGLFVVSAVLKPDVTVDAGRQALLDEVRRIISDGIEPRELEKAKNQALASQVRSGETVQGRASQLGYAAVILGDPNRVRTDLERLRAVTAEQVQAVARRIFAENNRVTLFVRPDETAAPPEKSEDKSEGASEDIADLPRPADMPTGESPRPRDLPFPSLRRLPNGLQVVVFPDASVPAVTLSLNALVGAGFDPPEQAGLAYVAFNMLRRGTTRHSGDELAELIDFHGMSLSQQVGHEEATLSFWTLREHLDLAAETLAEIAREPTFPEKEVASFVSRSVAGQKINERDPSTIATRTFARTVYGDYYLGRPSDGTSITLQKVARDDVLGYHERFIQPDVCTLILAGDITVERAFELAEKHFGSWEGWADEVAFAPPPEPPPRRIVLVDRPDATQSEIRIGQVVDVNRKDDDYEQVRLLSQVFGESFSARLNRTLRIEKGLTYGARGGFDVEREAAVFRVSTFTRTDKTAEAIEAALEEVVGLKTAPVTRDELEIARDMLIGQFQMALETPANVADAWWKLVVWDLPERWYSEYQQDITRVDDPSLLNEAATRKIDPARLAIVVVGRASEIKDDLAKIAPVEVISEESANMLSRWPVLDPPPS